MCLVVLHWISYIYMLNLCWIGEALSFGVQITDSVVLASSPSFLQKEDPARVPKLEPMLPTRLYMVDLSREPAKYEHQNALFLAYSGHFWKQAIYSLYYICKSASPLPCGVCNKC